MAISITNEIDFAKFLNVITDKTNKTRLDSLKGQASRFMGHLDMLHLFDKCLETLK